MSNRVGWQRLKAAFALTVATCGIVLLASGCSSDDEAPAVETPPAVSGSLASVPSETPTTTRQATATPSPSRTPTPRRTATPRRATATPSPTPTPKPLSFKFGTLVDPGDRAVIEAGVSLGSDYAAAVAGVRSTGVTAYAYVDLSNVSVQWEGVANAAGVPVEVLLQTLPRYVGETFPAAIFINTGATEWRSLDAVEQLRLAAHEYMHTLQMSLAGPLNARAFYTGPVDIIGVLGPNWLLEGSAEYLSWSTLEWVALGDLEARVSDLSQASPSPRDLETYASFYGDGQSAYDASFLTTYYLVGDRGPTALIGYYRYLGYGLAWPNAFLLAFGRSLDEFYREFDEVVGTP